MRCFPGFTNGRSRRPTAARTRGIFTCRTTSRSRSPASERITRNSASPTARSSLRRQSNRCQIHLHRSARDTHQRSVFLQPRVVRVGCISNGHCGSYPSRSPYPIVTNFCTVVPFRFLVNRGALLARHASWWHEAQLRSALSGRPSLGPERAATRLCSLRRPFETELPIGFQQRPR